MGRIEYRNIGNPPQSIRAINQHAMARGKVHADKGDYGAGLIEGVSLVTRGEALGHGLWLDSTFIEQVYTAGIAKESGFKARFAHPGLSSDGIGSALGRWKGFKKLGSKQVFADLHLLEAAKDSPQGNLNEYVIGLATEDPELFASSIVFWSDEVAEAAFADEHSDDHGRFISPDKENRANLRHARLLRLDGADLVDEPAANPGGLFARGNELPAAAEALLSFAVGITDEAPEAKMFGIDPERVKTFLAGFLARHGLRLALVESETTENTGDFATREEINARFRDVHQRLSHLENRNRRNEP